MSGIAAGESDGVALTCALGLRLSGGFGEAADAADLAAIAGPDAPGAISDALLTLQSVPDDAAAIDTLDGYFGPVCQNLSQTDEGFGGETEGNAAPEDPPADPPAEPPADSPAGPSWTASLSDPVYVDLIADCVYGSNEAGSCEELAAGGMGPGDNYGLGNSLAQAPAWSLRQDCIATLGIECAELNRRVQQAPIGDTELTCTFVSPIALGRGDPVDFLHAGTLTVDAPAGVVDALSTLEADPTSSPEPGRNHELLRADLRRVRRVAMPTDGAPPDEPVDRTLDVLGPARLESLADVMAVLVLPVVVPGLILALTSGPVVWPPWVWLLCLAPIASAVAARAVPAVRARRAISQPD